jgi:hypothetical protein
MSSSQGKRQSSAGQLSERQVSERQVAWAVSLKSSRLRGGDRAFSEALESFVHWAKIIDDEAFVLILTVYRNGRPKDELK